jgi:hypothetical protein
MILGTPDMVRISSKQNELAVAASVFNKPSFEAPDSIHNAAKGAGNDRLVHLLIDSEPSLFGEKHAMPSPLAENPQCQGKQENLLV